MAAPTLAVSVLARRGNMVLLVRRARPPTENAWALPGGKVAAGERLTAAAAREVMEETRVVVSDLKWLDLAEVIERDDTGVVTSHHVIMIFAGTPDDAEPVAGDDAAEARWVPLAAALRLALTADTRRLLAALLP